MLPMKSPASKSTGASSRAGRGASSLRAQCESLLSLDSDTATNCRYSDESAAPARPDTQSEVPAAILGRESIRNAPGRRAQHEREFANSSQQPAAANLHFP